MQNERETTVILSRHGQYDAGVSRDQSAWGWLTQEGIAKTTAVAHEFTSLRENTQYPIDFLILHSLTQYKMVYGMRAAQTARITAEIIHAASTDQFSLLRMGGKDMKAHQLLRESNMEGPYLQTIEDLYGSDAWEHYYRGLPQLEELRIQNNIESPQDVASRASEFIRLLQRYSARYHTQCKDRELVIIAFTHADVLRCFLQNTGVPKSKLENYKFLYNQQVPLTVTSSHISCIFEGETYNLMATEHS